MYSPGTKVLTEPEIVTGKFSLKSSAIAPNSTYFVPASSVISASPTNVIIGAVVSITFTTLFNDELLLALSVEVYVNVYTATTFTSTVPVTDTLTEPSTKSLAVAPWSLYSVPASSVIIALPFNVITGAVVSTTFTVLVNDDVFLDESETVYFNIYSPGIDVFTDPLNWGIIDPSNESKAVAPKSWYEEPASWVTTESPFNVITGAVVSIIVTVLVNDVLFPAASVAT